MRLLISGGQSLYSARDLLNLAHICLSRAVSSGHCFIPQGIAYSCGSWLQE